MITHSMDSNKPGNSLFESLRKLWIKIGLFLVLLILIYQSVMLELYSSWLNNHYYYHGFLIPLISLYLIFKNRSELRRVGNDMYPYGIILSTVGLLSF